MEQINESNFERVCKALKKLKRKVWERVVRDEPEWKETKPLLERYGPNRFLVFMVMAGLNDYQLKGVAEIKYWPLLVKNLMDKSDIPNKPSDFIRLLKSFYANERLYKNKLRRLERFLNSKLALKLWQMPLRKIAESLGKIWYELAETMRLEPDSLNNYRNRKTIVFAMKCLAIGLLISEIKSFEFNIPIPVDSRIKKLTFKLGLLKKGASDMKIQLLWQMVLKELRNVHPYINMVHLDSFLWQKADTKLILSSTQNTFEDKQKLGNNFLNKESKKMTEKRYGKIKDIYRVVEKGNCIELYVLHDNEGVKRTLRRYKDNPRYFLDHYDAYSGAFISAKHWLANVIDDYRSYFEQNKVDIIFKGETPPTGDIVSGGKGEDKGAKGSNNELIRKKLLKLGFNEEEVTEKIKLLNNGYLPSPKNLVDSFLFLRRVVEKIIYIYTHETVENVKNIGDFVNKVKQAIKRGLPKYLEEDSIFVWKTANPYVHEEDGKPPLDKVPMDFSNCRKIVKYILKNLEI